MALRSELSNTRIELEANLESVSATSASGDGQIQSYAEQVNSVAQAALKPGDRVRLKSREGILVSNNRQNQDEKDLLIEPRNPVPGGNIDYVWWSCRERHKVYYDNALCRRRVTSPKCFLLMRRHLSMPVNLIVAIHSPNRPVGRNRYLFQASRNSVPSAAVPTVYRVLAVDAPDVGGRTG